MIIAKKCVERRAPLIATGMEVYRATGRNHAQQAAEAKVLIAEGRIEWGRTFFDVYYKIKS